MKKYETNLQKKTTAGRIFLLPNEIFILGLNPGELSVYAYLIDCENRETHQCWPSIGRIRQRTGMNVNTIAKHIRQLEEKQYIDVEPTKMRTKIGKVRNGTLQFTIRPVQEAVNYKREKDLSALLEPCGAVVTSSCHRQLPREALGYTVSEGFSLAESQS